MKKFAKYLVLFLIGPAIAYVSLSLYVLPDLIEKTQGPSTSFQIKKSFKNALLRNYDLLILGNSRVYRGINPDVLEVKSYNFSHDNDNYNQMYFKMKYLEKNKKKLKYVIIGVDYFQFSFIADTRNYVYSDLFSEEYNSDYNSLSANSFNYLLQATNILKVERLKYLKNLFIKNQTLIYLKENGQYIRPGKAKISDKHFYSIKRLPIQELYFKKILNYCRENGIKVFLCRLPARNNALLNYSKADMVEFDRFISKHVNSNIHFLDYAHQPGWGVEDYTDITHLNEKAAERFSKQLNDTILQIMKK
jgi:hypothetical protein